MSFAGFPSTSMFSSASPRGTLRVSGKQNSLFPAGPVIKCLLLSPAYGFHQDSPSKRRKRTKKAKPLHFVIPDEAAAILAGCEKKADMSDKVKAIGNYVRELLYELKVRTVVK